MKFVKSKINKIALNSSRIKNSNKKGESSDLCGIQDYAIQIPTVFEFKIVLIKHKEF